MGGETDLHQINLVIYRLQRANDNESLTNRRCWKDFQITQHAFWLRRKLRRQLLRAYIYRLIILANQLSAFLRNVPIGKNYYCRPTYLYVFFHLRLRFVVQAFDQLIYIGIS